MLLSQSQSCLVGSDDCGPEACCVANYKFEFMRNRVPPDDEAGKAMIIPITVLTFYTWLYTDSYFCVIVLTLSCLIPNILGYAGLP